MSRRGRLPQIVRSPMGSLQKDVSDLQQSYTYGGKELQAELDLDWLAFPTRCYDSWSGKWLGVDILSEAKPGVSPYAYGLGNPVRFSDPTGMIEEENGLMTVSTDLWGDGRGENFIKKSTSEAKTKAAQTQSQQASNKGNENTNQNSPDPNAIWASALGKYFENEAVYKVVDAMTEDKMLARIFPKLSEISQKTAEALGAFKLIQAINKTY